MAKASRGSSRPAHHGAADDAAVDPRIRVSRERVLTTTLDLLTETGLGNLTIDEVSRRSGVAKTTIYRHWPNRSALVIDACSRMIQEDVAVPDTGWLEGDLRAILTDIAELLETARWSSVLPSIVDVAEHAPEFADIHSRIQRGHAAPLRVALDRAVRRKEIAPTTDRNAVAGALLGPLFYRRWFSREPIDPGFVEMIVRGTIAGLISTRVQRNPEHALQSSFQPIPNKTTQRRTQH